MLRSELLYWQMEKRALRKKKKKNDLKFFEM